MGGPAPLGLHSDGGAGNDGISNSLVAPRSASRLPNVAIIVIRRLFRWWLITLAPWLTRVLLQCKAS